MKFKVKCRKCGTIFDVESKFEPRRCMWCGHDDIWKKEQMQLTRSWLARQPYEAPAEAPDLNEMTDARLLDELTGIGFIRALNILNHRDRMGCRYEKPTDLLAVRSIGVGMAAKLLGKVRFG